MVRPIQQANIGINGYAQLNDPHICHGSCINGTCLNFNTSSAFITADYPFEGPLPFTKVPTELPTIESDNAPYRESDRASHSQANDESYQASHSRTHGASHHKSTILQTAEPTPLPTLLPTMRTFQPSMAPTILARCSAAANVSH